MKNEKDFKEFVKRFFILILLGLLLGNLLFGFYGFISKGSDNPDDFIMRYRESKYLFHGISPFDIIHGKSEVDLEIGTLWDVAGYTPWGMACGILFNFTFLSEKYARLLFFVLYISMMLLAAFITYRITLKKYSKKTSMIITLLMLVIPGWSTGLNWLNYGAIFGALFYFSVLILDKNPVLAGILIGIAATKPQLAAPFYLALLLKKKWKTFFVSIFVPFTAWGVSIILTETSPFYILQQFFELTNELTGLLGNWIISFDVYYSISFGGDTLQRIGMILCVLFAFYIWSIMKKNKINDNLTFFSVSAILSGMWTYSQSHDRTVLMIVILCIAVRFGRLVFCGKKYLLIISIFLISCIIDTERFAQMQSCVISIGSSTILFYDLLKYITWFALLLFLASFSIETAESSR